MLLRVSNKLGTLTALDFEINESYVRIRRPKLGGWASSIKVGECHDTDAIST